jgi:hypothetical protein
MCVAHRRTVCTAVSAHTAKLGGTHPVEAGTMQRQRDQRGSRAGPQKCAGVAGQTCGGASSSGPAAAIARARRISQLEYGPHVNTQINMLIEESRMTRDAVAHGRRIGRCSTRGWTEPDDSAPMCHSLLSPWSNAQRSCLAVPAARASGPPPSDPWDETQLASYGFDVPGKSIPVSACQTRMTNASSLAPSPCAAAARNN